MEPSFQDNPPSLTLRNAGILPAPLTWQGYRGHGLIRGRDARATKCRQCRLHVLDADADVYYARKNPQESKLKWQIALTKPLFSANSVLVCRKCPKVIQKYLTFLGHFVNRSFVFIYIAALIPNFFIFS
jgi:hypothetical protein